MPPGVVAFFLHEVLVFFDDKLLVAADVYWGCKSEEEHEPSYRISLFVLCLVVPFRLFVKPLTAAC